MKALMGGRSGGILRNQKWMSGLFRLIIIMLGMMITPVSTGALGRGIGGCLTRRIGRLDGSLSDLPGIRKPELFLMRRGGSYNQGYGGGRGFDYNDNPYDGYDDEDEYDDRYGYQAPPPPRQVSRLRGGLCISVQSNDEMMRLKMRMRRSDGHHPSLTFPIIYPLFYLLL